MGAHCSSDTVQSRGPMTTRAWLKHVATRRPAGSPNEADRGRPSVFDAPARVARSRARIISPQRLAVTLCAVWLLATASAATENPYRALKLFGEVLELVRKRYVEGVSRDSLTLDGLKGLVDNLDSYSLYLEDWGYRRNLRPGPLSFPRLGLCLGIRAGRLVIVAPLPGSSAEEQGLSPGDLIHEVGTHITAGMSPREVLASLAQADTSEFLVDRRGLPRPLRVQVAAEHPRTQPFWTLLQDSVGYVCPGWIVEGTGASTLDALGELREKGARALVLDLRMSPGEELEEAADIAGAFLALGLTVGYTTASHDSSRTHYRTESEAALPALPVAALVGPGTCCAGEMLAASLKTHRRAVLVGTESFGKGTLQKILPLTSSTGITITYARWYTPDGWCVDRELGGWDPALGERPPQLIGGLSPHLAVQADTIGLLEAALRFSGALFADDSDKPEKKVLAEKGFLFLSTEEAVDSTLALPGGTGRPVFLAAEREAALRRVREERARGDDRRRMVTRLAKDRVVLEALAVLSDPDRYESLLAARQSTVGEAEPEETAEPSAEPRDTPAEGL